MKHLDGQATFPSILRWHGVIAVLMLMGACTSIPVAIEGLQWVDQLGGRSQLAAQRDWAMCEKLVEQHRGLLANCMDARGWAYAKTPADAH